MHTTLLYILLLLFSVFILVMLARRIKVAYPIFLVLAGLGISFLPGIPTLHLDPDLIFLIFLPPLLYEAAWYTSWNDFWKWKRSIALLAFGLVFFTSTVVAYFSLSLIPGFTLALGFLLGGIISPPDAVAAASVLKGMPVPKRLLTILEGESLVNDASSLIVFKFAVLAVMTGSFSMEVAVGQFFVMACMGVVVGLAGAHVLYAVHRFLPTTPAIDAALTVMTPYILFLLAEHFHYSGVLAVVSGGLFMSYRSHEVFQTGSTRVNMLGVWTTLIFVMNALVFILIGLELPEIIQGLGEDTLWTGILYGLIISVLVILLRFFWVFPAAHIPRWLSAQARKDPSPGWQGPLVISWAGMRGVVSLATALSIPVVMGNGQAFPHRSLIILITFVVILVTLVFQGLSLPFLIRLIRLKELDYRTPEAVEQASIQLKINRLALIHLEKLDGDNAWMQAFRKNLEDEESYLLLVKERPEESETRQAFEEVLLEIYGLQRKALFKMRQEKQFSDAILRQMEMQLDINELQITGNSH